MACCSIATLAGTRGGMTAGLLWMDGIGVGCSTAFGWAGDTGGRGGVGLWLGLAGGDREAMGFRATTGGIAGEAVRDLMVAAVEYRFGKVNRLPVTIEWLSENASCYVAGDTGSSPATSGSNRGRRLS